MNITRPKANLVSRLLTGITLLGNAGCIFPITDPEFQDYVNVEIERSSITRDEVCYDVFGEAIYEVRAPAPLNHFEISLNGTLEETQVTDPNIFFARASAFEPSDFRASGCIDGSKSRVGQQNQLVIVGYAWDQVTTGSDTLSYFINP